MGAESHTAVEGAFEHREPAIGLHAEQEQLAALIGGKGEAQPLLDKPGVELSRSVQFERWLGLNVWGGVVVCGDIISRHETRLYAIKIVCLNQKVVRVKVADIDAEQGDAIQVTPPRCWNWGRSHNRLRRTSSKLAAACTTSA